MRLQANKLSPIQGRHDLMWVGHQAGREPAGKLPSIWLRFIQWLGKAAHPFNPSIQEAEQGGTLSLRPAWVTE